jgi:hypothetical protein
MKMITDLEKEYDAGIKTTAHKYYDGILFLLKKFNGVMRKNAFIRDAKKLHMILRTIHIFFKILLISDQVNFVYLSPPPPFNPKNRKMITFLKLLYQF